MDAICLIARYAERHKWLICCSLDRVLSKNTPRFFTCGFNKMFFPPIWIDSASVRFMAWREPTSMDRTIVNLNTYEHTSFHFYCESKSTCNLIASMTCTFKVNTHSVIQSSLCHLMYEATAMDLHFALSPAVPGAIWRVSLLFFTPFSMVVVGCLTSQQHASVSQGRICSDNFMCCHTEIEVADPTFHLTQSQYTDTGPTSPSADPNTPDAWQGSHWSANF